MAWTVEEKNWKRRDLETFDRLPKAVREAIRSGPSNVDVFELRRRYKTADAMVQAINTGAAPR
jgi:hypothetical protein